MHYPCFHYYIVITHYYMLPTGQLADDVPGPHMWASAGPCLSSSSPKQCKSDGRVQIYNSVSARSPLTKSKKKNYQERSNIKSASVSALTGRGSIPHKMAEAWQGVSALIRNGSKVTKVTATHLNL